MLQFRLVNSLGRLRNGSAISAIGEWITIALGHSIVPWYMDTNKLLAYLLREDLIPQLLKEIALCSYMIPLVIGNKMFLVFLIIKEIMSQLSTEIA